MVRIRSIVRSQRLPKRKGGGGMCNEIGEAINFCSGVGNGRVDLTLYSTCFWYDNHFSFVCQSQGKRNNTPKELEALFQRSVLWASTTQNRDESWWAVTGTNCNWSGQQRMGEQKKIERTFVLCLLTRIS